MTWVRLILDDRSWKGNTSISAIVNVYDITSDRADRENKPNLLLRNNQCGVDLRPGKYIAEIRLPAGNLVRKEVEVKDQPTQDVHLDLDSPHEWLWLKAAAGDVGSKGDYEDARAMRVTIDATLRDARPYVPRTWIVSSSSYSAGGYAINSEYLAGRPGIDASEIKEGYFLLHPELRRTAIDRNFDLRPLQPRVTDTVTQFFELDPANAASLTFNGNQIEDYYRRDDFQRWYLWTQSPGFPPQYSVIPIPWQHPEGGNKPVSVQVYVSLDPALRKFSKNYDALHRIAVTVDDEYFSSFIGYLGSGDVPSASVILGQAKEFLRYKVKNPLAAAAGAYVLLEQDKLEEHFSWHDWIRNLMNLFKWLPDGAIQYAWLELREKNMRALDADIRNSLLEAYNRGLPYYSAGVKLLLNGLTVFSQRLRAQGRGDSAVEKALSNVRILASRTDRNQPFTSVIAD